MRAGQGQLPRLVLAIQQGVDGKSQRERVQNVRQVLHRQLVVPGFGCFFRLNQGLKLICRHSEQYTGASVW